MPELAKSGAVELVRMLFLQRAAHLKPSVTTDLDKKCHPVFSRINPEIRDTITLSSLRSEPRLAALNDALTDWAKPHHLQADWCLERALKQLEVWTTPMPDELYDDIKDAWGGISVSLEITDNAVPPLKGFPSYAPGAQERGEYLNERRKRLDAELSRPLLILGSPKSKIAFRDSIVQKLERYCEEVENWFRGKLEYLPVLIKDNLDRNLTWAVKVQVMGASASEIATEEEREITTVSRAVKEVLAFIALPPRPDFKPGRRHGSKTKYPRPHSR